MKKLLSVLLCVLMVTMLVPSAMAADFTEKTFNFSESTDVSHYGLVGNVTLSTITYDSTGGVNNTPALKLTYGGSNAYINFLEASKSEGSASVFEVKYSFMLGANNVRMRFCLKDSADVEILNIKNNGWINGAYADGAVKFLGQYVKGRDSLTVNEWYDIEMLIDITQGYGRLKLKKSADSESAWEAYHVFAANTAIADGGLKDMTKTVRLGIGICDSVADVYIDNYSQKLATDVKPVILDADDFSNGINTWTKGNFPEGDSSLSANTVTMSDQNSVLKMDATGTTAKNTSVYKTIDTKITAGASENTNYIFKFKFGGTSGTNTIGASLGTATNNTETWLIRIQNSKLNMFTAVSGTATNNANFNSFGEITGDTLYDAEAVYNPTTGKLRVAATNASGTQYSATATLGGAPTKFAFRNHTAANVASTAYFDDFESGVLKAGGPVINGDATVASGDTTAASLDETVIFTYDRTILQDALATAEVKLNDIALTNDIDYTITSKGNQVMVTLKDLAKATDYTVELTGVKDLAEVATTTPATAVFHTSAKDIEATQPVLSGTTLSTTVKSWYAQGNKIKLIAALYNAEGTKLVNVAVKEFTVKDRNGEVISHDFSDVFNADGKKMGFVWSDFATMTPYAAAYSD